MAGTMKERIGLILKIKDSVNTLENFLSRVFDGGYFPTIADKAELAFSDGHYYF
jgi:hypothetical protein